MSNIDIKDVGIEDVLKRKYDLCIFATGYEKRARYLLSKVYKNILLDIPIKLCFPFNDHKERKERKINDALFSENEFICLSVDNYIHG